MTNLAIFNGVPDHSISIPDAFMTFLNGDIDLLDALEVGVRKEETGPCNEEECDCPGITYLVTALRTPDGFLTLNITLDLAAQLSMMLSNAVMAIDPERLSRMADGLAETGVLDEMKERLT